MTESEYGLSKLHCKNEKCKQLFDYFGWLGFNRGINCIHCGKSSQCRFVDFIRYNPAESPSPRWRVHIPTKLLQIAAAPHQTSHGAVFTVGEGKPSAASIVYSSCWTHCLPRTF